jgi:MOSC domain-containing protein YiiM
MSQGTVEAIHIAPEHEELPHPVPTVTVEPGKGMEGDRHFFPAGDAPPGQAITLIEAEALESFGSETGIELSPAAARRQVLTRGIGLNDLVGKRFRVGDVLCEGVELCEPCNHLASLTDRQVLRGMVHRAGLNADVLSAGEIAVGDPVRPEPPG